MSEAILKARRGIGLIRHLSQYVSRDVLDQMYKLYVHPHLDYGDIVYHKYDPDLSSVITKRPEQTQYAVSLAVTGAWRGTSKQKLYDELGWESLHQRRWYRRLCHFFKLKLTLYPAYLFSLIPPERQISYDLRNPQAYAQIEPELIAFPIPIFITRYMDGTNYQMKYALLNPLLNLNGN